MIVTRLDPPTDPGVLFSGQAVSTRGRRYYFCADANAEISGVFREEHDGYWKQIGKGPVALQAAVANLLAAK